MRMLRMLCVLGLLLAAPAGCTQELDRELMNVRQQVLGQQRMYAEALRQFVKVFEETAAQRDAYHRDSINADEKAWIESHTVDGKVVADVTEFQLYSQKRDEARLLMDKQQKATMKTAETFREAIDRNLSFLELMNSKEVSAQKAKESAAAAVDASAKFLGGVITAAAPLIPFAF